MLHKGQEVSFSSFFIKRVDFSLFGPFLSKRPIKNPKTPRKKHIFYSSFLFDQKKPPIIRTLST
ncbi:hypothetical protein CVU75_00120 [Candidatus Dependentiae bacterium HGW-Dependentiae-1]|nr:MAG: hypothetical protein CVU75_00120 [Candidatus Dependentiae bacterium HGW-Dependentiae-1]